MAEKVKSSALVFIVLIILSLVLAGAGFFLFQKEHTKNVALQDEMDDLKARQRVTESKLEESKRILSSLELKLKDTQGQVDVLNTDLQQEKSTKMEALAQIDQLRTELEQQKNLRSDLEGKFTKAQKDAREAQARLRDLESKKMELESKVNSLQERSADLENKMNEVELGKIVVSPESSSSAATPAASKQKKVKPETVKLSKKTVTPAPERNVTLPTGLEGKVLVVNKDYNFAVINLGTRDGVVVGNLFAVYRSNKYIGDVKIEKVHDSMSAADFISDGIKDKISEGDKVVRKTG